MVGGGGGSLSFETVECHDFTQRRRRLFHVESAPQADEGITEFGEIGAA